MARIRSIKPEYWTSEQVMELSRDARLAFIGLWNFCDDAGIHPANPKRLKAEVFPADDLTGEDVRRLVDEMIALSLIDEYEIDGQRFWIVTGWHHQKIDKPTFQHPRPDGSVPDGAAKRRQTRIPPSNSTTDPLAVVDDSSNARRTLVDSSPPESSRVESNGVDKNKGSNDGDSAPSLDREIGGLLTAVGISTSLIGWERQRGKAARNMTPSQQQVIDLASMRVSPAELRKAYDLAVADRLATGDSSPVNAGFVRAKLESVRRPPPPKREDDAWRRSDAGIARKASELSIVCPPGKDYAWLRERCESELRRRAQGVAA